MMLLLKFLRKAWLITAFNFYVLWKLVLANLRVAHDVLTPTSYMKPGVVLIPLDVKTDMQIFILANVITLTPGSITIHISDDKKCLYVHGMFIDDVAQFKHDIKFGFERKIQEIFQ